MFQVCVCVCVRKRERERSNVVHTPALVYTVDVYMYSMCWDILRGYF